MSADTTPLIEVSITKGTLPALIVVSAPDAYEAEDDGMIALDTNASRYSVVCVHEPSMVRRRTERSLPRLRAESIVADRERKDEDRAYSSGWRWCVERDDQFEAALAGSQRR